MSIVLSYLRSRYLDENGQGIVEYALILAFVVVLAAYFGSSGTLGAAIKTVFTNVSTAITGVK